MSRYPAPSHTFIQREVSALRRRGLDVHTFGLRRADSAELLSPLDRVEQEQTRSVLPCSPARLVSTHLHVFKQHPGRYLATAFEAFRSGRGLDEKVRHLGYFAQAAIVRRWCDELQIDHLHAHFERPAADVAMLVTKLGGDRSVPLPWSFTAHRPEGYMDDKRALTRKVHSASFVVCVSHYGRSQLMGLAGTAQWDKLRVVRCGVDSSIYQDERSFAPRISKLLTVARLEPVKGHAVLLRALAELRAEGVRLELLVVGEGSQRQALEELTATLGLEDCVEFVGNLEPDEVRRRYRAADLFCLPSFDEGVPVVLMEAMAMELPVLATGIAGVPELIEDGTSGHLVRPGTVAGLSAALRQLCKSGPEARTETARAGRARVVSEFDVERSAAILQDLFTGNETES